jgi:hypothetical protein
MKLLQSYGRRVDLLSDEVNLLKFGLKKVLTYLKSKNPDLDSCEHEFSDDDLILGQSRKCLKCNAPEELIESYILCRELLKDKN